MGSTFEYGPKSSGSHLITTLLFDVKDWGILGYESPLGPNFLGRLITTKALCLSMSILLMMFEINFSLDG